MRELGADNTAAYLIETGRLSEPVPVREMAYGVSNVVLWVDADPPFVLKQSRKQLRTKDPWFSKLERVFRESESMQALRPVLGPAVPEVLFEDRANFLFAMSAVPADAVVWKQMLLDGNADPAIARKSGELLGAMHAHGVDNAEWEQQFGDQEFFHQLRLEPYYLRLPKRAPQVAEELESLIAETGRIRTTLVHADYSPKNMLIRAGGELALVDYETVHFGDPAFDLGFFLAHLSLKAIYHSGRHEPFLELIAQFWKAYLERVDFEPEPSLVGRGSRHLAACVLVRIDGTSPVDYLSDPKKCDAGRAYARDLFNKEPTDWAAALDLLRDRILATG